MIEEEPEILWFEDVKLKRLKWLWPNRIPLGKLSLIVGDPEVGKSFLTLYMAAQVSTGRPWADVPNPEPPGSVIILTTEDDIADTVGVRLKAAGADMSKICTIKSIKSGEKRRGLHNLVKDFDILLKTVRDIYRSDRPNVRLIIIDPLPGYMEGKSENKNAEVREYLNPLADLATQASIAIVGISHLNKNQMTQTAAYRVLGSIGFTATVRAVWLVHKDPEDETRRLFVPSKGNLSRKPTGLSYTFINTPVKTDEGMVDMAYCAFSSDAIHLTAEQLLAPPTEKKSPKKDSASDWLQSYLKDGPKPATEILNVGSQMGFSRRTLERLKSNLGIQAIKTYNQEKGTSYWEWSLLT